MVAPGPQLFLGIAGFLLMVVAPVVTAYVVAGVIERRLFRDGGRRRAGTGHGADAGPAAQDRPRPRPSDETPSPLADLAETAPARTPEPSPPTPERRVLDARWARLGTTTSPVGILDHGVARDLEVDLDPSIRESLGLPHSTLDVGDGLVHHEDRDEVALSVALEDLPGLREAHPDGRGIRVSAASPGSGPSDEGGPLLRAWERGAYER